MALPNLSANAPTMLVVNRLQYTFVLRITGYSLPPPPPPPTTPALRPADKLLSDLITSFHEEVETCSQHLQRASLLRNPQRTREGAAKLSSWRQASRFTVKEKRAISPEWMPPIWRRKLVRRFRSQTGAQRVPRPFTLPTVTALTSTA
jgi:hypothetical protein